MATPTPTPTASPYTPLDPSTKEIRILQLLSPEPKADRWAPIHCTLTVVSLLNSSPSPPSYEALSYVWGDSTERDAITINGHTIPVTRNLVAALRRLRTREPRNLWVDAVCINQEDVSEKQSQIPLMGTIYGCARDVVVWLGEPTMDMITAFKWVNHHAVRGWSDLTMTWFAAIAGANSHGVQEHERRFFRLYFGLVDILTRPYWSRMWTFQEFWVARRSPILVSGKYEASFKTLAWRARAVESLYLELRGRFKNVRERGYTSQFSPLTRCLNELGLVAEQQGPLSDVHLTRAMTSKTFGPLVRWLDEISLKTTPELVTPDATSAFRVSTASPFRLLAMTANRQCQHQHDRIYGIYSFMPELAETFPADYSKPSKQVVHETTVHLVAQHGLAHAIKHFPFHGELVDERGVLGDQTPSWGPDLIGPSRQHLRLTDPEHYGPHATLARELRVPKDLSLPFIRAAGTIMYIPGQIIGTCTILHRLSDNLATAVGEARELVRHGLSGAIAAGKRDWYDIDTLRDRRAKQRMLEATFSHILLAGNRVQNEFVWFRSETMYALDMLPEALGTGNMMDMHVGSGSYGRSLRDLDAACRTLPGKAYFSVMGRVGVTGRRVRTGDEIAISSCFPFPVIVRRSASFPWRRMVLPAYIDGLMNNKFKDLELCQHVLEKPTEMLRIY